MSSINGSRLVCKDVRDGFNDIELVNQSKSSYLSNKKQIVDLTKAMNTPHYYRNLKVFSVAAAVACVVLTALAFYATLEFLFPLAAGMMAKGQAGSGGHYLATGIFMLSPITSLLPLGFGGLAALEFTRNEKTDRKLWNELTEKNALILENFQMQRQFLSDKVDCLKQLDQDIAQEINKVAESSTEKDSINLDLTASKQVADQKINQFKQNQIDDLLSLRQFLKTRQSSLSDAISFFDRETSI